MFAINLTYYQVKSLVSDLVEAEFMASLGGGQEDGLYYAGQADAYRAILNITYTDEEITEIINEIGADDNDEQ